MKIGRRGMGLMFVLFCSAMTNSSFLREAVSADAHYQETDHSERNVKNGVSNQIGTRYRASMMSHGSSHGSAEGGHGGGDSRPHTGGTAVIPIYAAGSAHHRQGHRRSAANRKENSMAMALLAALVSASIAHL